MLPPSQIRREPEPPGRQGIVEEVLPPSQIRKEELGPSVEENEIGEVWSLNHIPEEFEPSVIEDIIEELLPPSQVQEEPGPSVEENEIGKVWPLNQLPEEFEPSIIENIIEELLPPSQVPEEDEAILETEENIIYDEKKELISKQEEIANSKALRKRQCPKCRNKKRTFISELEDKKNIIMQSPRLYGKKFRCNICATEWK